MSINYAAPWHRASFERFVNETLPQLLAERLPLAEYHVEEHDEYNMRLTVSVSNNDREVTASYIIPQPNQEGIFYAFDPSSELARPFVPGRGYNNQFWKGEWPRVVVPIASSLKLDTADIRCFGEQLYDFIEARLGEATPGLPWNEHLLRSLAAAGGLGWGVYPHHAYRAMPGYHQLGVHTNSFETHLGGER